MYCRVINKLYILPTVLLRANSQITHILVMCSHASINLPITLGLEVARGATTLANWFSFLTASEARHFSLPMRLERTVSTGCDRCMMTAFCLGAKLAKGELWGLEIRCRNSSQVDDGICSLEHFKNLPQLTQIRFEIGTQALTWRYKIHVQDVIAVLHKVLIGNLSIGRKAPGCSGRLGARSEHTLNAMMTW